MHNNFLPTCKGLQHSPLPLHLQFPPRPSHRVAVEGRRRKFRDDASPASFVKEVILVGDHSIVQGAEIVKRESRRVRRGVVVFLSWVARSLDPEALVLLLKPMMLSFILQATSPLL